jgi:hypothetical protein
MRRYFPKCSISVWPHPEVELPQPRPVARVVVLGNLAPEKGLRVVVACAQDAARRGLPLTFRARSSAVDLRTV